MKDIKGIIFDYGGTIDTNSRHWSEVLWEGYLHCNVPVTKQQFRDSYVFAERALAKTPYIRPEHDFHDLLIIKCDLETLNLVDEGHWHVDPETRKAVSDAIAQYCYDYVLRILGVSRPVLDGLAKRYPLVLVSNFYGNIQTILKDFKLEYFQDIIESAVVGVRKPDPQIFQLGVDALGLPAENVLVVGDSFSKDIVPAHSIGCKTVWIKGQGWGNETIDESVPDHIITDIADLPALFLFTSK